MSLSKVIDTTLLAYYDSKVDDREDAKIAALPLKTRNDIVSEYFKKNRNGQVYGVKFAYNASNVLQASGTKYGANASLSMTASTRTVVGTDNYSDKCLFKHFDANIHQDENGDLIIDYLSDEVGFSYTGKVNVVCLYAPVYERVYTGTESSTNYLYIEWCDTPRDGFTLNPLCKDSNGNNRGFFAIAKFPAGLIDGVPYSSAGLIPWLNEPSYDKCVDTYHLINNYQCSLTMAQMVYLQRMFMIKFGSTNFQANLGGVTNYNYTRQIGVARTNKNYVMVSSPGDLYVGTSWDIRAGSSRTTDLIDTVEVIGKDTSFGTLTDINSKLTISDETYTITSETFDLVCKNVDGVATDPSGDPITISFAHNGEPVNVDIVYTNTRKIEVYDSGTLIASTSATASTTNSVIYVSKNVTTTTSNYIHTSIYTTGYSLGILGNDGCYMPGAFSANYRFPSVLGGVELLGGAAEIIGNVVIEYDSNKYPHVLVCNDPSEITKDTSEISSTYTDAGHFTATTTGNGWKYQSNIEYNLSLGAFTSTAGPGSSTSGLCDSIYYNAGKSSGKVAAVAFGDLYRADHDGIFCLDASSTDLSTYSQYISTRPAFVTKF